MFSSRAYWVSETTIAWNVDAPDGFCYLYASKAAALSIDYQGIKGFSSIINYNLPFMLEKPYFCQIEWLFLNLDKITRFTFFVGEDVRIKLQEDSGGLPANVIP